VKYDHLMPRFATTHQFDATAGAIQLVCEQTNQRFVCRGVHGRRGDSNSQFVAKRFINLIGGGARLQFYRQQRPVRLRTKKAAPRQAAVTSHILVCPPDGLEFHG